MTVGEKLKNLRQKKDMTIREVARHFNIGKTTYANYEYDQRKPDYEMLKNFAEFYDVSVDYLVGTIDAKQHSRDTFTQEELLEVLPDELRELFKEQNIGYVRFAQEMIKEQIDPSKLMELVEITKKLRKDIEEEKNSSK